MPIEQNPAAYYNIYLASQKRVQNWVQETNKQLQAQEPRQPGTGQTGVSKEQESTQVSSSRLRDSHRSTPSKPRTHESGSRSRPSSGSKGIKVYKTVKENVPQRSGRSRTSQDPSLSTYLPYGILPLILAVTGKSVLSVILAVVLLVGYNFNTPEVPTSSSRKHRHS